MNDEPWEYGDMGEEEEWPETPSGWNPAQAMLWVAVLDAALVGGVGPAAGGVGVMEPVHEENGQWYFWDETWADRYGSYPTEEKARQMLGDYVKVLNGVHL